MPNFTQTKMVAKLPRIPLEGNIDLTYRCNNNCRHCWLWRPTNSPEIKDELTYDEICNFVDQARQMGTQSWGISGGEPMLRPDFPDIFEYITSKATSYSLNTNGTLITPSIAKQMRRKGSKMIALYGATAETYEHIARHPGGFEMAMQGFRYLQEAGAGFTVQIVPMRDNWHEWDKMQDLAKSLSPHWRVGASWLYLSADRDPVRNAEITRQRLDPKTIVELDKPDMSNHFGKTPSCQEGDKDGRLFASCIASGKEFHIDPFGKMTFCTFAKDSTLTYDLRNGTFQDAWDNHIPSLAEKILGGSEYSENCSSCDDRANCKWCGVYGFLENGSCSSKVNYLCEIAQELEIIKKIGKLTIANIFK